MYIYIYIFSRVENFKLGFKPNTLRYSWQYRGFTDIGYSGVILTMPVDYITHPFLNYLISSSYRKGRVGLISILESSKVGNSASMRSLTRHIKLYIFLLLFAKLNQLIYNLERLLCFDSILFYLFVSHIWYFS